MPIRCEIVSQDRMVFEGDADIVVLPGESGEMGILPNHAPLLSTLKLGVIVVRHQEEEYDEPRDRYTGREGAEGISQTDDPDVGGSGRVNRRQHSYSPEAAEGMGGPQQLQPERSILHAAGCARFRCQRLVAAARCVLLAIRHPQADGC